MHSLSRPLGWALHHLTGLLGQDLDLSVARSFVIQLVVFFSVVLFQTLGMSRYQNMLFLSSSHLCLIIGLFRDLFVSLMGLETVMLTKCFEPLHKRRARIWIQ